MSTSVPHVSRLVPPGASVVALEDAARGSEVGAVTLSRRTEGDPVALGRLLADVEPHRADDDAVIATDAVAEVVRFLAVLAVLEDRAPMPDYDLDDPSLKWHAPAGVRAVPNPPTVLGGPTSGGAA